MEKTEEVASLMDQLSKAYADPEVKADQSLSKLILKCAQVLEKTNDVNLVSAGFRIHLSNYDFYFQKGKLPKSVADLYDLCKKNKGKYNPLDFNNYFGMVKFIRHF